MVLNKPHFGLSATFSSIQLSKTREARHAIRKDAPLCIQIACGEKFNPQTISDIESSVSKVLGEDMEEYRYRAAHS